MGEEELDLIIDNWLEDLKNIGIEPIDDKFYWSCSYSQGDGLCFDFKLYGNEAIDFLKAINFGNVAKIPNTNNIEIETYKNSFGNNYYHNKTRNIEVTIDTEEDVSELTKEIHDYIRNWYDHECEKYFTMLLNIYEEEMDEEE